jgi:hypothetical protein
MILYSPGRTTWDVRSQDEQPASLTVERGLADCEVQSVFLASVLLFEADGVAGNGGSTGPAFFTYHEPDPSSHATTA